MTDVMRKVGIAKVTLNFGAGREQSKLDKGITLLKMITGVDPVKTITRARIPGWGLRPGLPVGAKLTLRGEKALEVLKKLLVARDNKLPLSCFDKFGNISFGVPEYIDIPGTKYDPKIGIIGLQVSVTLMRPGYRVQMRKVKQQKLGTNHRVNREDAMAFFKDVLQTECEQ